MIKGECGLRPVGAIEAYAPEGRWNSEGGRIKDEFGMWNAEGWNRCALSFINTATKLVIPAAAKRRAGHVVKL